MRQTNIIGLYDFVKPTAEATAIISHLIFQAVYTLVVDYHLVNTTFLFEDKVKVKVKST